MNSSPQNFALVLFLIYVVIGVMVDWMLTWSPKGSATKHTYQPVMIVLMWPLYFAPFLKNLNIYLFKYIPLIIQRWFNYLRTLIQRWLMRREARSIKKDSEKLVLKALQMVLFSGKFGGCPECKHQIARKDFARLKCKNCKKVKYQPFEKVWNGKNIADLDFPEDFLRKIREGLLGKNNMRRLKKMNERLGIED